MLHKKYICISNIEYTAKSNGASWRYLQFAAILQAIVLGYQETSQEVKLEKFCLLQGRQYK
jgi:hypothetical protein